MQLFLPCYGDFQAIRTQKTLKTEGRVRELMGEINDERGKLQGLEAEIEVLREAIRRKIRKGAGDDGSAGNYSPVKTSTPHSKAVTSRLASLSPSVHADSITRSPDTRVASRRLNSSMEDPVGKLFTSMYTKDYFPKKNLGKEVKVFGRPKDKVWEYREQLLKNQHVIRGQHK